MPFPLRTQITHGNFFLHSGRDFCLFLSAAKKFPSSNVTEFFPLFKGEKKITAQIPRKLFFSHYANSLFSMRQICICWNEGRILMGFMMRQKHLNETGKF